jgi:hypothetical protein
LFFSFLPKRIGHSEKSRCLKFIGILGILTLLNNNWHLTNVEDSFHLSLNFWGILKISSCFKKFGQFENLFCPVISSRLWRWKNIFLSLPTILGALSHESQYVGSTNITTNVSAPLRQMFHTPRTNVLFP